MSSWTSHVLFAVGLDAAPLHICKQALKALIGRFCVSLLYGYSFRRNTAVHENSRQVNSRNPGRLIGDGSS